MNYNLSQNILECILIVHCIFLFYIYEKYIVDIFVLLSDVRYYYIWLAPRHWMPSCEIGLRVTRHRIAHPVALTVLPGPVLPACPARFCVRLQPPSPGKNSQVRGKPQLALRWLPEISLPRPATDLFSVLPGRWDSLARDGWHPSLQSCQTPLSGVCQTPMVPGIGILGILNSRPCTSKAGTLLSQCPINFISFYFIYFILIFYLCCLFLFHFMSFILLLYLVSFHLFYI